MGWKGIAIGAWVGSHLGPLGTLIGAAVGHGVEKAISGKRVDPSARRYAHPDDGDPGRAERAMVFCASAAAMLAKMAKADGVVSKKEISAVERAFTRLGFSPTDRAYAVDVFRRAKDDGHTIYDYADDFASVVINLEVRELFYELLWDLACADGTVSQDELRILQLVTASLKISPLKYVLNARRRLRDSDSARRSDVPRPPRDELAEAYEELGVDASVSDDEVKKSYREKAKRSHPDVLRAQGLPDEMVEKATEKMARINSAWAKIREARGI